MQCPTVVVGSHVETAVATTGSRRCVRSSPATARCSRLISPLTSRCARTDQDSRVLARRTVKAKAWQLREAVEWGMAQAAAAGFSSVVVACEPTGHRWRVLDQIAAEAGARLVCVQPLLVHRARESEDFTHNKSDETDAMIIARLVTELRCYLPERAEPLWARLRHLGARRAGLVTDATAARQQVTDLLECAWPAAT